MKKLKIEDHITHIDNPEDLPFLKTKLFDVNMRLFNSSEKYRDIIMWCCEYIQFLAMTEMEGYKKPHGMSGANAGIPFNIIGIVENRGEENESCHIMINPKIIGHSVKMEETSSNCGSIRLEKSIKVMRWHEIRITYYDTDGNFTESVFGRKQGGFTIQHEIDHNLGILITDRYEEQNSKAKN